MLESSVLIPESRENVPSPELPPLSTTEYLLDRFATHPTSYGAYQRLDRALNSYGRSNFQIASMPPVISRVKAKKKSAFSCEACRNRKVKCGGEQPMCKRCLSRDEDCQYRLSPTLTYTQRLEARIEELESDLLRACAVSQESTRTPDIASNGQTIGPPRPVEPPVGNAFHGLRLDAKGCVTYSTSTSVFGAHLGEDDAVPSHILPPEASSRRRERLVQNAWQQKSLEVLAETPEPFQYMLTNHWCWIQPLFNFIYRPAFTRDMQTLGPYYSHTLLNAVLAHATRWCRDEPEIQSMLEPYDNGLLFSRHARTLVFEEISQGRCSIPTVQTLLLLSAQECGAGNRTQAWLYSGIAFRLIEDMGICVDNQLYARAVHLDDEDIEIRNRLFWSCYFWDKMISLYLGRTPVLQDSPISPPQSLLDDSSEDELWKPHGLPQSPGSEYPPTKAFSTSCFTQMCRLSVILNQILCHMYNPQQEKSFPEVQACLDLQGRALGFWWESLPECLKIRVAELPSHAPPSHIVTLNCLFHTVKILLYRPMLFKPYTSQEDSTTETRYLKECLGSASSIIVIFELFRRTFGYSRVVMALAYSVYTAASVFLLKIQATSPPDEFSMQRMSYCVSVLNRVKSSTTVIQDALALISKSLRNIGIDMDSLPATTPTTQKGHPHSAQHSGTPKSTIIPDGIAPSFDMEHFADLRNFAYTDIQFDSEILDVFSGLQPISISVGALGNF